MALRKIAPSTLKLTTSPMLQTLQLTSKISHLPPPSFSSPPPLFGGELQDLMSVMTKQMIEMLQALDVKMQNRFDQVIQQQQDLLQLFSQQQQDLPQKHEVFMNVAIASQGLAELVDAVAVDESYPHLDYDLMLDKIEATLEPHIDSLIINQVMEQGVIEDELSNLQQAFIYQDVQFKETETPCLQLNCEAILGENVKTTELTNFTKCYLQLMDNFDDQEVTAIDSVQLLKITKIDVQTQPSRKYNKADTQMIMVEGEEKFAQFELIRNFCNQILRFDNRKALIWESTWHRKKTRVRFKCDIKCYLMG